MLLLPVIIYCITILHYDLFRLESDEKIHLSETGPMSSAAMFVFGLLHERERERDVRVLTSDVSNGPTHK